MANSSPSRGFTITTRVASRPPYLGSRYAGQRPSTSLPVRRANTSANHTRQLPKNREYVVVQFIEIPNASFDSLCLVASRVEGVVRQLIQEVDQELPRHGLQRRGEE